MIMMYIYIYIFMVHEEELTSGLDSFHYKHVCNICNKICLFKGGCTIHVRKSQVIHVISLTRYFGQQKV